jgi:hypothetical protein
MSCTKFTKAGTAKERAHWHEAHGVRRPTKHALSTCERLSIAASTAAMVPSRNFGCGLRCKAFSEGV